MKIFKRIGEWEDRTKQLISYHSSYNKKNKFRYMELALSIPLYMSGKKGEIIEGQGIMDGIKYLMISFYLINGKLKIEFNIFNG